MTSLLGWIGNIFLCWGIWQIGNRKRYAHVLTVVGETAWIAKSLIVKEYDLAVICAIFAFLAARCYVKWGE